MAINLNDLAGALMGAQEQPAAPRASRDQYGTIALDAQGTPTVMLDGGKDYAPCTCMVGVHHGDRVMARVVNHKIVVFANVTAPTTDDTTALLAIDMAGDAQAVAQATNQHFWNDTNGAHITDVTQDEWTAAVDDNFSDYDPDTKPYHNQLLNSLGILLRTALNNLVSITRSAIAFYDGQGNNASNIVARFGSDGAQIGKLSDCVKIDNDGFTIINNNNETLSVSGVETQYVKHGEIGFIPSDTSDNPHLSINGGWTDLGGGLECADITLVARMPNANGAAMEIYSDSRNENYVRFDCDIKTAKDTAWTTLNSYIQYRIHHGVCYVLGISRGGGASVGPAGGNIGTLPEGARPLVEVIGVATTMAKRFGQFSIDTNGVITVWNLTQSSAYWAFNASYPVG